MKESAHKKKLRISHFASRRLADGEDSFTARVYENEVPAGRPWAMHQQTCRKWYCICGDIGAVVERDAPRSAGRDHD